jgi:hypothetical protein
VNGGTVRTLTLNGHEQWSPQIKKWISREQGRALNNTRTCFAAYFRMILTVQEFEKDDVLGASFEIYQTEADSWKIV